MCQNISLVKIMLTMNIEKNGSNPGNIWKKVFKALPKLHRPLYIFGFLIRQFRITGLSPVQLLWSSFHFMLRIFGFFESLGRYGPHLYWKWSWLQNKWNRLKSLKCSTVCLCMNVMFFFLPPSQCFIEELYPSTVFWLVEWNRAMGYSFNEYS